jgi:hypothetical protein
LGWREALEIAQEVKPTDPFIAIGTAETFRSKCGCHSETVQSELEDTIVKKKATVRHFDDI